MRVRFCGRCPRKPIVANDPLHDALARSLAAANVAERLLVFQSLLPMRSVQQQSEDITHAVLAIYDEAMRELNPSIIATGLRAKVIGLIEPGKRTV